MTINEAVRTAEKMVKTNGGTLPNPKWLRETGYSGLCVAMRKHPELFAHIPQEKGRTPEEWVRTAEKLAETNSGA